MLRVEPVITIYIDSDEFEKKKFVLILKRITPNPRRAKKKRKKEYSSLLAGKPSVDHLMLSFLSSWIPQTQSSRNTL